MPPPARLRRAPPPYPYSALRACARMGEDTGRPFVRAARPASCLARALHLARALRAPISVPSARGLFQGTRPRDQCPSGRIGLLNDEDVACLSHPPSRSCSRARSDAVRRATETARLNAPRSQTRCQRRPRAATTRAQRCARQTLSLFARRVRDVRRALRRAGGGMIALPGLARACDARRRNFVEQTYSLTDLSQSYADIARCLCAFATPSGAPGEGANPRDVSSPRATLRSGKSRSRRTAASRAPRLPKMRAW